MPALDAALPVFGRSPPRRTWPAVVVGSDKSVIRCYDRSATTALCNTSTMQPVLLGGAFVLLLIF
jgi:hypothetical protein